MTRDAASAPRSATLIEVLTEARARGFLGPGALEPHVEHARRFAAAVHGVPSRFLDLGAGGGVPGLVLAAEWPDALGVLLDASTKRTDFLRDASTRLGFGGRIAVVCARAEEAARAPHLRGTFDLVVARSFGAPAVTAECAAGFLSAKGRLVVSEPPVPGPVAEAGARATGGGATAVSSARTRPRGRCAPAPSARRASRPMLRRLQAIGTAGQSPVNVRTTAAGAVVADGEAAAEGRSPSERRQTRWRRERT